MILMQFGLFFIALQFEMADLNDILREEMILGYGGQHE